MDARSDVPLDDLAASWARYLRAEQKSDRTVGLYRDAVTYRCGQELPDSVVGTRSHIVLSLVPKRRRPVEDAHVHAFVSVLSSVLRQRGNLLR